MARPDDNQATARELLRLRVLIESFQARVDRLEEAARAASLEIEDLKGQLNVHSTDINHVTSQVSSLESSVESVSDSLYRVLSGAGEP